MISPFASCFSEQSSTVRAGHGKRRQRKTCVEENGGVSPPGVIKFSSEEPLPYHISLHVRPIHVLVATTFLSMSESIASSSRGEPSSKRPRKAASPYNSGAQGKRDGSNSKTENSRKPRAVLSCAECNRRKQKCDRQEPCTQCVARGVPHLCTPVTESDEGTSL